MALYLKAFLELDLPLTSKRPDKRKRGDELSCPARTFSNVVFPDPDGPIIANNLPGFASPVTFFNRNRT